MPWTPAQSLLTTTNELTNLSYTISYVADPLVTTNPVAVTISADKSIPSIQISNSTISGYFSDSFDYTVKYIDKYKNDYTVTKFSNIDISKLYAIYKYTPNMTSSITHNYIATAKDSVTNTVLDTKTYSIVVTQNWTTNKNLLLRYLNFDKYFTTYVVVLLNNSGIAVPLLNNLGNQVFLERT
jgi:hypothetical protein